jgi:hypothetical protein
LDDTALTKTAVDTADWQWSQAFDPKSGSLRHQFFHGHAGNGGFLDDYALLGQAFLSLSHATGHAVWRTRAQQVADAMLTRFARPDGHLATTADAADLLVAPPVEGDSTQPSGQSAAVALLLGLAADGGEAQYAAAARRALAPLAAQIDAQPVSWGAMVTAVSRPNVTALAQSIDTTSPAHPGLRSSADHVHASARLGSAGNLRVTVAIDDGYHVNANPASDPNLIPTELDVDGLARIKVEYPKPQIFKPAFAPEGIAVYSGRIALRAMVPRGSTAPAHVRLRVQACSDQFCLTPATLEVPVQATR